MFSQLSNLKVENVHDFDHLNSNLNNILNQDDDDNCPRLLQKSNCGLPKLTFNCQLAQGSKKGIISGFSNIKELYQKIGECFKISINDVSF